MADESMMQLTSADTRSADAELMHPESSAAESKCWCCLPAAGHCDGASVVLSAAVVRPKTGTIGEAADDDCDHDMAGGLWWSSVCVRVDMWALVCGR